MAVKLSCGGKFLKFLVFFFNAIVFVGGGIMGGWGAYLLVEASKSASSVSLALPGFITAFGFLIFLIGFLGCFGACYNNVCMLKTFAVIVGILLVAEIVCGAILLVYRHNFIPISGEELKKEIEALLAGGANASTSATIDALDSLQEGLECCGGTGPSDWQGKHPASCCEFGKPNCSTPYQMGCAEAMYNAMKDSALAFGIVIFLICLIQVGAIICACCLASKVNEYEKV